jgi:3',5'-nucleoside bisphosphate phosphatase
MTYYYDLHIHSVLSPCADELMTPNNIFNMAHLKGLHIISVTDHNTLKQIKVCQEISESYDMLFIPGVEIAVKEGVHILCYFKHIEDALSYDTYLETFIHKQGYDKCIYKDQEMMDIYDEVISIYPFDLSPLLDLTIEQLILSLSSYEHILVYAHADRKKHGAMPYVEQRPLDGVEFTKHVPTEILSKAEASGQKILFNSDAHTITEILECTKQNKIELESLTIDAFFAYFNHG